MKTLDPPPRGDSDGTFFLTVDANMRRIRELGERVAQTSAPVLIMGESGVGKEVLARYIHSRSPRAAGPWVRINCAAVPPDLLESELFGHERGAFTGAHQRREGAFEIAHQGSLLLDEIGEMSLALQAKLLDVVEDSAFTRVGGLRTMRVDTRLIATTNKPLERAMAQGEFRQDLYFRLKVIRFRIPPLRERRADIPGLCEHFVKLYAPPPSISGMRIPDKLMDAFLEYRWPGNVRELRHAVQRYVILPDVEMVLSDLDGVEPQDLSESAAHQDWHRPSVEHAALGVGKISLKTVAAQAAQEAEKRIILRVLEETRWNRRRAAARLDICYKTLLNKLRQWEGKELAVQGPSTIGPAPQPPVGAPAAKAPSTKGKGTLRLV